jgi:hypothetical protein
MKQEVSQTGEVEKTASPYTQPSVWVTRVLVPSPARVLHNTQGQQEVQQEVSQPVCPTASVGGQDLGADCPARVLHNITRQQEVAFPSSLTHW